ncbi:hypothetical protein IJI99_03300 [bacterium]|nr:hypothetical protein [bacterium]
MRGKLLTAVMIALLLTGWSQPVLVRAANEESKTANNSGKTDTKKEDAENSGIKDLGEYDPCIRLPEAGRNACHTCMTGNSNGNATDNKIVGFWTAIGCISTDPVTAVGQFLDFLLGVGGFFVVVQILIGSFELIVSQGNPQALQSARERITNSVIALLFIVFSVTILEFVGVNILNLPGFFDSSESDATVSSGSSETKSTETDSSKKTDEVSKALNAATKATQDTAENADKGTGETPVTPANANQGTGNPPATNANATGGNAGSGANETKTPATQPVTPVATVNGNQGENKELNIEQLVNEFGSGT